MPNRFLALLAQADPGQDPSLESLLDTSNVVLLIMMASGGICLLLVTGIILRAMKMSERSRELQHAERVKAIEAGQPWQDPVDPPEPSLGNRFWICFWIMLFGAAIPFMSVSSSLTHINDVQESVMLAAYISAGVAGATASICSAIIMCSAANGSSKDEREAVGKDQA